MKNILFKITLVLLLCVSLSLALCVGAAAQTTQPVLYDEADLLTAAQETALLAEMERVSEAYGVQIIIAAVKDTDGKSVDSYLDWYYDSHAFGTGESRDGVLLLLSMEERDWRILSNGRGSQYIPTDRIDKIGEDIVPYLSDGEYAAAFTRFVGHCEYYIDGEINGFPFDLTKNIVISLVIGVAAALIVTALMRRQLKSVRRKAAAGEYLKEGSMQLTTSSDLYLYRHVSKTAIPKSNSSGSSGSSRSSGGGKF